jgi:hypothetical protein
VNIFYLEKDEENWVELYVHDQKSFDQVKHFKADLLPKIEFLEHDVFKVVITLPLIDKNFFGLIIGGKIDKKPIVSWIKYRFRYLCNY